MQPPGHLTNLKNPVIIQIILTFSTLASFFWIEIPWQIPIHKNSQKLIPGMTSQGSLGIILGSKRGKMDIIGEENRLESENYFR